MVPLNSLLTSVHPGHLLGFSQPWPPLMTHASKSPSFSMKFDLQKDDIDIVILKFRPFNGMTFKMIIHLAQLDSWRRWRADQCGLGDGQQVFNQLLLHNNVHYVAKFVLVNIPHICHISYTSTFWGLKIVHSKVRKFATKIALWQNSVNQYFV